MAKVSDVLKLPVMRGVRDPLQGKRAFWESGACDGDGGSGDQAVVEGE